MRTGVKIALTVSLAFVAVALWWTTSSSKCEPLVGSGVLSVDLAGLRRGDAQAYCYTDAGGRKLRFILARGDDGAIRSVFDACRQCFVYHRGFRLGGGELICRVCGNHYPIDAMTTGKASCVPVQLPHELTGKNVRIKTADLESGRTFF